MPRAHADAIAEGASDEFDACLDKRLKRLEMGLGALRTEMATLRGEIRSGLAELKAELPM